MEDDTDQIFQAVQSSLEQRDYPALADACDQILDVSFMPAEHFIIHMFAYFLSDKLPEAKFLWKIVPTPLKEQSMPLRQAWEVGKALWTKQWGTIWQLLDSVEWPPEATDIVADFRSDMQFKLRQNVQKAYSVVDKKRLTQIMGSPDPIPGWQAKGNFVTPIDNSFYPETAVTTTNIDQLTQLINFLHKT